MKALLAVILCFNLSASLAMAQTFRVGVELQPYPPYYGLENGEYQGYARDLLDAFASAQGHRFTYVAVPVKRLLGDFLAGKLDFKYPDNPQWSVEQKRGSSVFYSSSTAPFTDGVLVLPDRLGRDKNWLKVLGTQLGFTPLAYLADIDAGRMRLSQTSQIDSLLKMALSGRVDGIYLNPLVARHALKAAGLAEEALVFDANLPHLQGDYFLSSLHQPQVIREFDAFLERNQALVTRLRSRYGIAP